jgi:hypothetical protein
MFIPDNCVATLQEDMGIPTTCKSLTDLCILCSHLSSTQNHCLHVLHLLIAEVDHKTLILVLVSLANSWLQILELSKGFYDCC